LKKIAKYSDVRIIMSVLICLGLSLGILYSQEIRIQKQSSGKIQIQQNDDAQVEAKKMEDGSIEILVVPKPSKKQAPSVVKTPDHPAVYKTETQPMSEILTDEQKEELKMWQQMTDNPIDVTVVNNKVTIRWNGAVQSFDVPQTGNFKIHLKPKRL